VQRRVAQGLASGRDGPLDSAGLAVLAHAARS
jgi:hypothetical protein